jgi:hypothetical protein
MRQHLYAFITYFILAALTIWLMGCRDYQPFPEGGEITRAPRGYEIHCQEFPDSIFCEEAE